MIPRLPNEDLEERNAMGIRAADQQYVFLRTGQLFFTASPALVETVLGSCLSVVMMSPRRRFSAICQGFLPRCLKRDECAGACAQAGMIVECSVMVMADRFRRIGIPPDDIKVKVIGGAEIPEPASKKAETNQIGRQNATVALERIEKEGLTVAAMEVGGTDNGAILVRRLPLLVEMDEGDRSGETAWKRL
jgi:chemotaxis protein CheD